MTNAEARAILTTYGAPVNIAKHIEAINTAIRALGGKATMDKPISAYSYLSVLEDLKDHGFVLVDMREVTT